MGQPSTTRPSPRHACVRRRREPSRRRRPGGRQLPRAHPRWLRDRDRVHGLRFVDAPEVARTAERGVTLTISPAEVDGAAATRERRRAPSAPTSGPDAWAVSSAVPGNAISRRFTGVPKSRGAGGRRVEFSLPAVADERAVGPPRARRARRGARDGAGGGRRPEDGRHRGLHERRRARLREDGDAGPLEVEAWPEDGCLVIRRARLRRRNPAARRRRARAACAWACR